MVYNTSNITAANDIVEYITALNQLSGNVIIPIVVSILYLVVFASLSVRYGAPVSGLIASFVTFMVSIMFYFSGLTSATLPYVTFFVLLITAFIKLFAD